ncbi:MAG TPA: hypothetical protein VGB85_01550 [Nannocystis sp.]|jgi:hypothetical protein
MRAPLLTLCMLLACNAGGGDTDSDTGDTGEAGLAPVRVFAVGNHHGLDYVDSYAAFEAEMQRLMAVVQPNLSKDHPNLVVFGEDVGLPAAFLGARGASARASTTAQAGYLAVAIAYEDAVVHYTQVYPHITFNRAISLALTDTMARAFFGTFPKLAKQHGVWLSACTLLADTTESTDPADIAAFGDPELTGQSSVYLPVDEHVYNVCYIWDDAGEVVGASRKVNLVALEGMDLLDLSPEILENVEAFDTPFGRVAIAISLDAFVPAYVQHINDLGAQIVLQNDANPGAWAIIQPQGGHDGPPDGSMVWQPEEWEDSTLRMVTDAAYPNIEFNVCPMIVGNLFDIPFDGQSSITARHPPADNPARGYIGNAPSDRFLALAPWAFPDPGDADPGLTLEQRREAMLLLGEQLAPGSGHASENKYREDVIWADIQVIQVSAPPAP